MENMQLKEGSLIWETKRLSFVRFSKHKVHGSCFSILWVLGTKFMVMHQDSPQATNIKDLKDLTYLACSSCSRPWMNRSVGNLHVQVIIVYKRPCPLYFAGLESVRKRPKMGIPKESAVGVILGWSMPVKILFIITDLRAVRPFLAVPWRWSAYTRLRGGAIFRTVVLDHEVINAMDSWVVSQISSTIAGSAACAMGVRPYRCANLHRVLCAYVVMGIWCCYPELGVTLQNSARGANCCKDKTKLSKMCDFKTSQQMYKSCDQTNSSWNRRYKIWKQSLTWLHQLSSARNFRSMQ